MNGAACSTHIYSGRDLLCCTFVHGGCPSVGSAPRLGRHEGRDRPGEQGGPNGVPLILDRVHVRQRGEIWLHEISLELRTGMTVLIGPANAGKTTLMRVVAGLLRPTSGRVLVNGADVTATSVRKRSVAFVYQQFINYPSLSV